MLRRRVEGSLGGMEAREGEGWNSAGEIRTLKGGTRAWVGQRAAWGWVDFPKVAGGEKATRRLAVRAWR